MFITYLTEKAYFKENQIKAKEFNYKQLSDLVQEEACLEPLAEIIPPKITVKEAIELQRMLDESSDDTDEEEEEEEDEETDENKDVVELSD